MEIICKFLTFSKGNVLDGSGPSVAFDDLHALEDLREDLRIYLVSVDNKCMEHLGRWNRGGDLHVISDETHILMSVFDDKNRKNRRARGFLFFPDLDRALSFLRWCILSEEDEGIYRLVMKAIVQVSVLHGYMRDRE